MHVTKNTLFHYDKIGLFSPEIVLDNEYRYYSIHQIEVLEAIIMLKELGMSLKEIQAFLSDRTPEKLLELFEKEEQILAEKIRLMFHQQYYVAVICIDLPSDIFCILDVTNLITDAFAVVLIKIDQFRCALRKF